MARSRITAAILALTTVGAVVLASCGSGGGDTGPATDSTGDTAAPSTDTINSVLAGDPTSFNPALGSNVDDYQVARLGFDTLLRKGDDGAIIGGLASEWSQETPSKYVFTIKSGPTCGDGTPITPTVVADSLTYLATTDSPLAANWRTLAFGSGDATMTPDDAAGTVTIELSEPYTQLIGALTLSQTGIICPAGLADTDGLAAGTVTGAWSGPYTLTSSSVGAKYTYTLRSDYDAWPDWPDVQGTPAKTINFQITTDGNTIANLLQSGGVDVASLIDLNMKLFTDDDAYDVKTSNNAGFYIVFNERPQFGSPFTDQKVRAAVASALDREAFNQAQNGGLGVPMTSVATADFACVNTDESLLQPHDVAAAKQVLDGVTIRFLGSSAMPGGSNYIVEALTEAGANVEANIPDIGAWATATKTEPQSWDMTLMGDINSAGLIFASLNRNMGPSFEEGGRSWGAQDNVEGQKYLTEALTSGDEQQQCENFLKAQQTMLERVDVVPLDTSTTAYIARPGFAVHTFSGDYDISAMRIVK